MQLVLSNEMPEILLDPALLYRVHKKVDPFKFKLSHHVLYFLATLILLVSRFFNFNIFF